MEDLQRPDGGEGAFDGGPVEGGQAVCRPAATDLDQGFPTRAEQVALWESASGRKVADAIDYWEIFGAMRFDAIMIKLGDRMVRAGIVPADLNMPVVNGTTDSLARLLERQGVAIGG